MLTIHDIEHLIDYAALDLAIIAVGVIGVILIVWHPR